MHLCFLQASYSVESDEQFAVELHLQEIAVLDDSHVARTLQQVILKLMLVKFSYPGPCRNGQFVQVNDMRFFDVATILDKISLRSTESKVLASNYKNCNIMSGWLQ